MIKKFFILIIVLIAVNECLSQNKVITLKEAISLAQNNNSDLINARLEKLKSEKKVSEVYSENLLPTITLSSQYSRALKKPIFVIEFPSPITGEKTVQNFEVGTDNTLTNTLNLVQSIPFLGTPVFQGINIARYYSNLQNENISAIESQVESTVKKSFFTVLLAKEVVRISQLSLDNAEENLNSVEKKYRLGTATEFDYLRAKVNVETLKPDLEEARNNLELARKNMKDAIGIKTYEDYDAIGEIPYDSTETLGDTEILINKIVEDHVALRQLNINKKINLELLSIDKASYLPKLYLFGQYSLSSNENDNKTFLVKYYFNNAVSVGLGLSWDLNFLKTSYKKDQSEIEVKKTDEKISDVKSKLKIQSQSVILRIKDAVNRIKSANEAILLSQKGLDLAKISYREGVIKQIDVLDAELQLNRTRLSLVKAQYDYVIARTDLEALIFN